MLSIIINYVKQIPKTGNGCSREAGRVVRWRGVFSISESDDSSASGSRLFAFYFYQ